MDYLSINYLWFNDCKTIRMSLVVLNSSNASGTLFHARSKNMSKSKSSFCLDYLSSLHLCANLYSCVMKYLSLVLIVSQSPG